MPEFQGRPPSLARFVKKKFTITCEIEECETAQPLTRTLEADALADAVGLFYAEGWAVVLWKDRPAAACPACKKGFPVEVVHDGSAGDRRSTLG